MVDEWGGGEGVTRCPSPRGMCPAWRRQKASLISAASSEEFSCRSRYFGSAPRAGRQL